jgi:branched-chain amino acid transport system ATP-binding protein
MLEVCGLKASYGDSQVLFGMDFSIGTGEVATLLGRNGMGKTTTIRALMGILHPDAGRIMFDGLGIHGLPSHKIAQAGIGLVPEGRQIFPNLSVRENLIATARPRQGADHGARQGQGAGWTFDKVLDLFPGLASRLDSAGNQLSGGEQQMLAVGRALMTNPKLLILDEATEGLAPLVRQEIWSCLEGLKAAKQSILVIDKNIAALTKIADRHHIVEKGRVVWTGTSAQLRTDPTLQERYLGV